MAMSLMQAGLGSSGNMEILGCRGSSYGPPSRKKPRLEAHHAPLLEVAAPPPPSAAQLEEHDIFECLPDECIHQIFTFLPSLRDRRSCAAVSRRWLHLQARMRSSDFSPAAGLAFAPVSSPFDDDEDNGLANDVRLALLAVGASSGGTLTELVIRADVLLPPSSPSLLSITDMGLKVVSHACSELKKLTIGDCHKVGKEGLSAIAAACPKLEQLHIYRSSLVDDDGLIPFAMNCPKLAFLSLDRCPMVGDRALRAFASFSAKLETLSLSRCPRVTDSGLATLLSSLPKLAKITISHMAVGDGALAAVGAGGGGSPKHVAICGCGSFTDRGLALLSSAACKLETLRLEKCHGVSTQGLVLALQKWSATLKSLSLVKCDGVGKKITSFTGKCRHLQSLEMKSCPNAGDEFISAIAGGVPRLRRITLAAMDAVTDRGFLSLLAALERRHVLSSVDLSGCGRITDRSVAALASSAGSSLVSLSLEGCGMVTDWSLAFVALLCPRLSELDLTNCRQISDTGVAALTGKTGLEMLSLEGCEGITDETLPRLEGMADEGSLVSINLKRCRGLSRAAVDSIHHHLWWCDLIR